MTQLLPKLKGVDYKLTHHAHVHTSEEAAIARGYTLSEGTRRGLKAMLIRSNGKFYMFALPGNRKLSFPKIKSVLKTKSASLATPIEVKRVTGCVIGSVHPCSSLYGIPTYLDMSALQNDEIDFNPGSHTATVTMNICDYIKLVKPVITDFTQPL